jgi:tetratricopeptide (TPR) repeat protein
MRSLRPLVLILLALPAFAHAEGVMDEVSPLQQEWATIRYQMPEAQRARAFEALEARATEVVSRHPGSAEPLIWDGIILSTWAGSKGGLGALSLVKQARKRFEQALKINPDALEGSAYTSLGSLYYQVPGWPIGFGDEDKAEELLKQALTIAPDGIDANYFYGDYLYQQERYAEAVKVLEHAAAAPPRPGRETADAGRQAEIAVLLQKVRAEMEG